MNDLELRIKLSSLLHHITQALNISRELNISAWKLEWMLIEVKNTINELSPYCPSDMDLEYPVYTDSGSKPRLKDE